MPVSCQCTEQQPVDEAQWRSAEKDLVVRVQWTDGTEEEVNGWTSQWTKSPTSRVVPRNGAASHPFGCEPQTSGP